MTPYARPIALPTFRQQYGSKSGRCTVNTVVDYSTLPAGDGQNGFKYLAPYIFRVAISNNRILKLEDGKVTFRYRTSDTGKLRICTLPAEEFIRRFLQHVLPKGFVKVRYYGFLSSGCRQRLAALRQQLDDPPTDPSPAPEVADPDQTADSSTNDPPSNTVLLCPSCGQVMQRRLILRPPSSGALSSSSS